MKETLLLIIIAAGIGIYQDINKPTHYELNMEDGSNTYVILQKNSSYACPLYCKVDHVHHAVVWSDENSAGNNQFVYHISAKSENGSAIFCSTKKILSMTKLASNASKEKLPDVMSASSEN